MTDQDRAPDPDAGFAARIAALTEAEAREVAALIATARRRADQVVEVMRSIGIPLPRELEDTGWYGGGLPEPDIPLPGLELGGRTATERPSEPEPGETYPEPATKAEEPLHLPVPPEPEPEPEPEPPATEPEPAPAAPEPAAEPDEAEPPAAARRDAFQRRGAILAYLREHPGAGLGQLVKGVNLPQTSVSRILEELATEGSVRKEKPQGSKSLFAASAYYPVGEWEPSEKPPTEEPPAEAERKPVSTEVPEELRRFPAAARGGPLTQRIEAARTQKLVYDAVSREPGSASEVAAVTHIPAARVTSYFRDLAEAGLIALTDRWHNGPVWARGAGIPQSYELTGPLADMPIAASSEGLVPVVRLSIARQQLKVLRAAEAYGKPFVNSELIESLPDDFPRTRLIGFLNDLAEQGKFLRRTGGMRRGAKQTAGRTAVEYVAASVSRVSRPSPASTVETSASNQRVMDDVRTAAKAREGKPFSKTDISEDTGLALGVVGNAIDRLTGSGALQRLAGPGSVGQYLYERPREPGAAAKIDAGRRKGPANGDVSDPVAGTGRQFKASSPEVNALINDVRKAGGRAEPTDGGHIAITWSDENGDHRKTIRSTPSGNKQREVMHDRARLRKEGLKV